MMDAEHRKAKETDWMFKWYGDEPHDTTESLEGKLRRKGLDDLIPDGGFIPGDIPGIL